jgi:hypothetical protein
MRFVEPYNRLVAFASDPHSLYSGIGAGQIEKALNFQWWPITKAILEYGIIPGLLFYAFFLYTLFNRAPRLRIAYMLAVWFTFEGALLTAVNPIVCMRLSTMFAIEGRSGLKGSVAKADQTLPDLAVIICPHVPVGRERQQRHAGQKYCP